MDKGKLECKIFFKLGWGASKSICTSSLITIHAIVKLYKKITNMQLLNSITVLLRQLETPSR
jgi:hypothetical protein